MNKLLVTALIASGLLASTMVSAEEVSGRGWYVGATAGYGRSNGGDIRQTGTAHARVPFVLDEADEYDLPVNVTGKAKNEDFGLGGLSVGYEWGTSSNIKPSIEFEGLYLSGNQKAHLKNKNTEVAVTPGTSTPVGENVEPGDHTFSNSADMRSFALMVNGIVGFDTGTIFTPYVGAGVGMAKTKLKNAKSAQTCKLYNGEGSCGLEMSNSQVVNHFNSDDSDSDYVFAAQAKLGVRAELSKAVSMFAEYRYLRLNSADYKFGSTVYQTHVETDAWRVKTDSTDFHFGTVGVQYAF